MRYPGVDLSPYRSYTCNTAFEAAGDESGWNLCLYGDDELLLDEPCPVPEPLSEAFYKDILRADEEQEREISE